MSVFCLKKEHLHMRNGLPILSKLLVMLFTAAPLLPAIEVSLTYDNYPADTSRSSTRYQPRGFSMLDCRTTPPKGQWKLPALKSRIPVYSLITLGAKEHLVILDQDKTDDGFYNKIYFDTNANRDLTDDPPITTADNPQMSLRNSNIAVFSPTEITLETKGKQHSYSFRFQAYLRGKTLDQLEKKDFTSSTRTFLFYLINNCCYRGSFSFKGNEYHLILNDYNCNGRFDEQLSLPDPGKNISEPAYDFFYLAGTTKFTYRDRTTLGHYLALESQLFKITVNIPEKKLLLSPCTEKSVTAKTPFSIHRLSLCSADGKTSYIFYETGDDVSIMPGRYKLFSYTGTKKDAQGDTWRISARLGSIDSAPALEVSSENPALPLGEPFTAKASIPETVYATYKKNQPDKIGAVPLQFSIEGSCGEKVTDLRHVSGNKTKIPRAKGGYRPKEPDYAIVKKDGELAAKGSFKYG